MIKEQIKAIIKQYADKGERLFLEASESNESYAESYWDGYKDCADGLLREFDDIQEEPVSEDLDSFAINYAQDKPYPVAVCQAVKVGANWQAEQDKQWLAEEHKHIFAKGRDSMKQQMMKETVTGIAHLRVDTSPYETVIRTEAVKNTPHGTLIKFIIIK